MPNRFLFPLKQFTATAAGVKEFEDALGQVAAANRIPKQILVSVRRKLDLQHVIPATMRLNKVSYVPVTGLALPVTTDATVAENSFAVEVYP